MALDLHGAWENMTVHHAPLYMKSQDTQRGLSIVRICFNYLTSSNQIERTYMVKIIVLHIHTLHLFNFK